MRPTYQIACLMVAMAGCTPLPDQELPPAMPPTENACGAADLQDLVGRNATVLETMRFGQTTRILRPGMAVTMDFSAERLNIEINDANIIEAVTCG
jgi:hypothetical protein